MVQYKENPSFQDVFELLSDEERQNQELLDTLQESPSFRIGYYGSVYNRWVLEYDQNKIWPSLYPAPGKIETKPKQKLFSANDILTMPYEPPQWLYQDIVLDRGITILGGDPKSFKSYFALYLSICMTKEMRCLERKTRKAKILYLDEENGLNTVRTRLEMLKKGGLFKPEDHLDIDFCIFANLKLDSKGPVAYMGELIDKYQPDLVIVDSLVRFFEGDENSSNDAKVVFNNLKDFMEEKGCSFLILHHNRKNGDSKSNNLRGSGDFTAMADVIMNISKYNDCFTVKQTENRHIENIDAFSFKAINENSGICLKYLGELESNQKKKDKIYVIIEDFLKNEATEVFQTKCLLDVTRCDKITDRQVYRVLNDLVSEGRLEKVGYGKYKQNKQKKLLVESDEM